MRIQLRIADIPHRVLALSVLIGILVVIGCGGDGTQNNSSGPVTYTIGGTIAGLSGSGLVLQDNGGNNLSVSAGATSFTFTTAIASGGAYSVKVLSQPSSPSQTCAVTSGTMLYSMTPKLCAGRGVRLSTALKRISIERTSPMFVPVTDGRSAPDLS